MKKLLRFVFAILILLPVCAKAGYIDIYEDTTINSDLDAIVRVHGSAQITVLSGYVGSVDLLDSSSAIIYGGNASYIAEDSSVLMLYGGDFVNHNPSVGYSDSLARIYVYGNNFVYQRAGGFAESGWLSGNWLNETSFNIYFRNLPQPFEQALGTNIFLVPEPATVVLMIMGVFLSRRRR